MRGKKSLALVTGLSWENDFQLLEGFLSQKIEYKREVRGIVVNQDRLSLIR